MDQKKVGQLLKQLRTEKAVTQAELGETLGVPNRSVSRWENGTTMPDLDLLIELANYYDIEVGEILDGKRRTKAMEKDTEELLTKVADYNNTEQGFFSRRMCAMFAIAIIGITIFAVIDLLGLERTQPYASIVSVTLGFVGGTLATGLLYASRYMAKLQAARARLIQKLRRLEES